MTSKPTRRPFRLEGLAFGEWRLQSTFATREAAVNWLRDRPTRIIDTRTGQDVTVEPTDDAEARVLAAEVASRGYQERAEKAEAKAARFAGLLGHQSRTLTDAIAAEVLRQKADAWDEGHRTPWKREPDGCRCGAYSSGECGCGLYGTGRLITPNPYRATQPTTTEETSHE